MANLSSFFPGGGGGIGQTITVGDYAYPNARSTADWAKYRIIQGSNNLSQVPVRKLNSSEPSGYQVGAPSAADTYITIADITSATNGGALLQTVIYAANTRTPSNYSGPTGVTTCKITIDGGTPIELEADELTASSVRILIGSGWKGSTTNQIDFTNYDTTTESFFQNSLPVFVILIRLFF